VIGYAALLVLAWMLSEQRRAIPWRTVLGGVALQWALAVVLLRVPAARAGVQALTAGADALQRATDQGTGFLFGYLAGGTLPFAETAPGASFILAFKLLPLVLVISALGAVCFTGGSCSAWWACLRPDCGERWEWTGRWRSRRRCTCSSA